jgi:pilus assembly protein CpaF
MTLIRQTPPEPRTREKFHRQTPNELLELLANPRLTDLCINGASSAFADFGEGLLPIDTTLIPLLQSDELLRDWVLRLLSESGKSWDARAPYIDFTVADEFRFHVLCPPLSPSGWVISIRKLASTSLQKNESNWAKKPAFQIVAEAFRRGESVLISGSTGSGKTTFAAELLLSLDTKTRTLILEDTLELILPRPSFLNLVSRRANPDGHGEVSLRTLLQQALRMRPDRVILGECRGVEVFDLLQALNTGHAGTLATVHANSARGACRRLELLCTLAPEASRLSETTLRDWISAGIQWIVHLGKTPETGCREIQEIARIEGREGDSLILRYLLRTPDPRTDPQTSSIGEKFREHFPRASI